MAVKKKFKSKNILKDILEAINISNIDKQSLASQTWDQLPPRLVPKAIKTKVSWSQHFFIIFSF